jgi:predicted nucleic acid-binding protein
VITLDASVLIAHLDSTDALHGRARKALRHHAGAPLHASVVTLAEVLVGPARRGEAQRIAAVIGSMGVEPAPLRSHDALLLAELRCATGLRMPDCCVLLTAQAMGMAILSFDDRLRRAAAAHGLALAHG